MLSTESTPFSPSCERREEPEDECGSEELKQDRERRCHEPGEDPQRDTEDDEHTESVNNPPHRPDTRPRSHPAAFTKHVFGTSTFGASSGPDS